MIKKILKKILPNHIGEYYFFLKLWISSLVLKGNNYYCNVCEIGWRQMGDFGKRKNVMCPKCFSLERHRLVYSYLINNTNIFSAKLSVLHFAPEKCLNNKIRLNEKLSYVTADLMNQHIFGLEVIPQVVMSVADIKFANNNFDIVICNHVLEHVMDDEKAMKEIYRVLKPDGFAILQVPINYNTKEILEDYTLSSIEREKQYGYRDHVRFYSESGYKRRLEKNGFSVELNNHVEDLDHKYLSLNPNEKLFICKKA